MSETTPEATATETSETTPTTPETPPAPKPSETVDFWKEKAREQEKRAKSNADAAKRLEQIEAANQTEIEKQVAAARKEGAESVTQATNTRLVASEARALAATARFRNPATAVRLLDLSDIAVTEDGGVDADAVKKLLDQLAADEPYLVDDGKTTTTAPGTAGIGVTGGASLPSDPRARRLAVLEADIKAGSRSTTT